MGAPAETASGSGETGAENEALDGSLHGLIDGSVDDLDGDLTMKMLIVAGRRDRELATLARAEAAGDRRLADRSRARVEHLDLLLAGTSSPARTRRWDQWATRADADSLPTRRASLPDRAAGWLRLSAYPYRDAGDGQPTPRR